MSPEVLAMRLPSTLAGPYHRLTRGPARPGNGWGVCAMAYGTHAFTAPLIDLWENNTCITQSSEKFFDFNGCDAADPTDGALRGKRGRQAYDVMRTKGCVWISPSPR